MPMTQGVGHQSITPLHLEITGSWSYFFDLGRMLTLWTSRVGSRSLSLFNEPVLTSISSGCSLNLGQMLMPMTDTATCHFILPFNTGPPTSSSLSCSLKMGLIPTPRTLMIRGHFFTQLNIRKLT